MTQRGNSFIGLALAAAVIALVLSIMAYATRTRPEARQATRTPATLDLSMVVATFSGQGMTAHRWYPTMLAARRGDIIDLAVGNPDRFNHQFEMIGYNLKTKSSIRAAATAFALWPITPACSCFNARCRTTRPPATARPITS